MKNRLFCAVAAFMLTASFTVTAQAQKDPVLLTVAGKDISLSNFENIYHKNTPKDSLGNQKVLSNYLQLFINFRLKVQEAEDLGMDTTAAFQKELDGYKKQLAKPYLTDTATIERLVKEAYKRLHTDIRASHLLIRVAKDAPPADTLKAYKKIMKIRAQIMKGESFAAAVKKYSEDNYSKATGGDLGYFTALQMVYPFETAAYNTPVGKVSMPVRTRFGYHLIKVTDRRPDPGQVHVAHIMIRAPKGITKKDSLAARKKIEDIYKKLQSGASFADLAKQYSEDKTSGRNGGVLPWFGVGGRMPVPFEKAAFALKKDGDYSPIVHTRFGWHIIKRLGVKGIAPYSQMREKLKGEVMKDSRSDVAEQSFIDHVKKEYHYTENAANLKAFAALVDSTYFKGNWRVDMAKVPEKELFSLGTKKYTERDFAKYLKSHQVRMTKLPADKNFFIHDKFNQYANRECITYEYDRLGEKYPKFKELMNEYKDGILLFDLTDKKVWSKAVKDTTGLRAYYEKHKTNYMWPERADASIYTCANADVAKKVQKLLKKGKSDADIMDALNKNSMNNVSIKSGTYEKKENSLVDANWKAGISPNKMVKGKVVFVDVHKIEKPSPKSLADSKGLVTSDYQNYLEKQWVAALRKKYPVKVNKPVLAQVK